MFMSDGVGFKFKKYDLLKTVIETQKLKQVVSGWGVLQNKYVSNA